MRALRVSYCFDSRNLVNIFMSVGWVFWTPPTLSEKFKELHHNHFKNLQNPNHSIEMNQKKSTPFKLKHHLMKLFHLNSTNNAHDPIKIFCPPSYLTLKSYFALLKHPHVPPLKVIFYQNDAAFLPHY